MWSEKYEKLSTYEKTEFRRIGNYLLSHTYMVRFTYDSGEETTLPNADYNMVMRLFEVLQEGITVNRQEYIDSGSFYRKNIRSRRSNEPPQPIAETPDIEKEILGAVVEKLRSGYSDARIKSFMDSLFANGKTEINSAEIAVNNDTDYILTLLSVVKAYKGRSCYRIQLGDGFIEKDGYRIPQFVLKKGGKH